MVAKNLEVRVGYDGSNSVRNLAAPVTVKSRTIIPHKGLMIKPSPDMLSFHESSSCSTLSWGHARGSPIWGGLSNDCQPVLFRSPNHYNLCLKQQRQGTQSSTKEWLLQQKVSNADQTPSNVATRLVKLKAIQGRRSKRETKSTPYLDP